MEELTLPLFTKDHDEIHLRFASFPLFFGPTGSHVKLYPRKGRLSISSPLLTFFVCSLPTVALFLSVTISLYTDFAEATKTHCLVDNVLPSISTAISSPWTQPIWRTLIYLHAPPRFIAFLIYRRWFSPSLRSRLTLLSYLIEILSLLSLTYFDSTSAHLNHVISFTTFGISSVLHMYLHTSIVSSLTIRRSMRIKRRSLISSLLCLFFCFLLFLRHNWYCEPYVFSVFALFEHLFVLSNIVFHSTFRLDFPRYSLVML
ncbi:hypothetical protein PENTCL1PPCAC_10906 [Pristionchus entomophagus]|uniref:CWH43-like N-terminal domain-containing protein n=1 Tax=Pristionchus entomophagus TaxID=358040 RepID=A0AAV5TAQ7_9BILA|nr:hypothetical protein PENTCL1PPCAC_10906 [Pristionchus entomophagus]